MIEQQLRRSKNLKTQYFIIIQNIEYQLKVELDNSDSIQIYQGLNQQTNQEVLIKIIDIIENQQVKKYQLMATMKFKNVMNILSLELKDDKLYLAMEFSQKTLQLDFQDDYVQKQQNARYIIKQIANGIMELHKLELPHLQIVTSNVVIQTLTDQFNNKQNIYKLCDYGQLLSKDQLLDFYAEERYYLAPEQKNKDEIIHPNKVDIWALGIICLELFYSPSSFPREKKIQEITQQDILQLIQATNCNLKFQILFYQMLQINPEMRFDIKQVLDKLKIGKINKLLQSKHPYMKQIEYFSNFNYNFSQEQLKGLNNG